MSSRYSWKLIYILEYSEQVTSNEAVKLRYCVYRYIDGFAS